MKSQRLEKVLQDYFDKKEGDISEICKLIHITFKEGFDYHDKKFSMVDKKMFQSIMPPTFFLLVYTKTKCLNKSEDAYKFVFMALRYFYFLDFYYETGDITFKDLALQQKKILFEHLDEKKCKELDRIEKDISVFWNFEKTLVNKIKERHKFKWNDFLEYFSKKSADAFYYSSITETLVEIGTKEKQAIYYNLQLRDLLGDLSGLEEDLEHGMPNILFLLLSHRCDFGGAKKIRCEEIYSLIKSADIKTLEGISTYICKKVGRMNLDKNLEFLKELNRIYKNNIDNLVKKIFLS